MKRAWAILNLATLEGLLVYARPRLETENRGDLDMVVRTKDITSLHTRESLPHPKSKDVSCGFQPLCSPLFFERKILCR